MAYSKNKLIEAQDKLSEIYSVMTRRERLALASDFGYGGTDESKLRSLRRISTGSLDKRQSAVVSRFFKPFITKDDPDAWLGRVPPFELKSDYTIQSYVMTVKDEGGVDVVIENNINLSYAELNRSRRDSVASTDLRQLFRDYSTIARQRVETPYARAIAFTDEGARKYITQHNASPDVNNRIRMPKKNRPFQISLISVFPPQSGQGTETKTFQRPIPKAKQETVVKRVNRTYGQYRRQGGRLS
tara:strand:+ start:676 stop:1407 length:732 start_codon:yes stop_codon:yes gene_type:complete